LVKLSEELDLMPKPSLSMGREETKTKAEAPEKTASRGRKTSSKTAAVGRPATRLPRFYSRLDLEEDQRQKLLDLQQRFAQDIAALREEITKLQQEREARLVSVLKPGQKRRLKQLQAESVTAKKKSRRD
jgi:hypothetical protein